MDTKTDRHVLFVSMNKEFVGPWKSGPGYMYQRTNNQNKLAYPQFLNGGSSAGNL